jgi:UDP-N-acetylglucosamine 2-epimerase (non-hydrolysing)/GDP/UDP-N,N'-diacetylbacillosamine 2-epimerase (hydrolysing)
MRDYGYSVQDIEKDKFPISVKFAMSVETDTPVGWASALGDQMNNLAKIFAELNPDIVLVTGDRAEMFIAAATAAYMNIPVAHIQAGDVSGHIDGVVRHAITKLAHIHFPACEDSAKRVKNLGEEEWRIFLVGAPQLDEIVQGEKLSRGELSKIFGFDFEKPVILLIQHPVLTEFDKAEAQMTEIMEALKKLQHQTIVVYPNTDAGGKKIISIIEKYKNLDFVKTYKTLNRKIFISLLSQISVLLGNSSTGILEAPSLKLAAVNIGNRQKGRMQANNVINVEYNKEKIIKGIKKSLSDENFKRKLMTCQNPYGDGHSSERIVKVLEEIEINDKLLNKIITY